MIDRFRKRQYSARAITEPRVAVLIPAYNEEKVIVRTIRSVLKSDYPNLRVIVIDDGSLDRTFDAAREAYPEEIEDGRLLVLTKPNGGKAEALNFGLNHVDEEVYVGIDADTVIAPDAVSKLVRAFADPTGGRGGRQCQGGEPHQSVDAVAGARIHHQPELRAARHGSVQRGHGGSGRDRRVAHRRGEEGGTATA